MTSPALLDWQVSLNSLVMGAGTPYHVIAFDPGKPDVRAADVDMPGADGIRFGRDYLGGTLVTLEILIDGNGDPGTALDSLSALRKAWNSSATRFSPGAVDVLTYQMPGHGNRRIYGRPRGQLSVSGLDNVGVGVITTVGDFQALDHLAYGQDRSAHVPLVPASAGGVAFPLSFPFAFVGSSERLGVINVNGDYPSWLAIYVFGPIAQPVVECVNRWRIELNTTLAYDQSLTISPEPWKRTVLRNDGANLAGAFSARSPRLSRLQVPPGEHQVWLRGTDPTGTAYMQLRWSDTFAI